MSLPQITKRAVDVTLASLILLLTAPIFVGAILLILVLEGRPIFYVSKRYVSPYKAISVLKFRSMVRDATSPRHRLRERFMRNGFLDIPRECEVYTPIGRILEKYQIVELPQMINVIAHGMSLLGNRPLPWDNVQLLQQYEGWERRFASPAGISGIAQVVGKLGIEPEQRLALEGAYAARYLQGNIVLCDFWIFLYTVRFVLFSIGVPLERAFALVGATMPTEPVAVHIKARSTAV